MQKSLLLLSAAVGLICSPMAVSAKKHAPSKARQAMVAANRKAASMSAETVARFYHPQTIVTEEFDRENNQWVNSSTHKCTYNKAGQVTVLKYSDGQSLFTYSDDGLLIKEEDYQMVDGELKLESTVEYTYDTVVKGLVVREVATSFDVYSGEIQSTSAYGGEITRNSDGNITKFLSYSEWNGQKSYDDSLDIEYGADKKAVKIINSYDGEVEEILSDIVWAETDGQIISYEYDDYNGEMYFSNNRIASATINSEEYPQPGKFTATYDGDSYHSKLTAGDDLILEINFKCLEKFADTGDFDLIYSYDCTSFEVDMDYDDETNTYHVDYTCERTEENRASAFGFVLSNKRVSNYKYSDPDEEDETEVDEEKSEVTYDESIGYPLTVVNYSTSYAGGGTGALAPRTRVTYSDYVNVDDSGVSSVNDDSDVEPEYYTLQGLRVQGELAPGIYICRKGNKTFKIFIR